MKRLYLLSMATIALGIALSSCKKEEPIPAPELDVNREILVYTKVGGDATVEITSNQKWEIEIEETEWLSASSLEGEGDATITFTATPYGLAEPRENLITVKSGTLSKEIAVTQEASDPVLEVDKESLAYKYNGGQKVLTITSNTSWEVVIDDEDD